MPQVLSMAQTPLLSKNHVDQYGSMVHNADVGQARGPLFDSYVMVDWSAASTPRLGKDSIWYCVVDRVADYGLHPSAANESLTAIHQETTNQNPQRKILGRETLNGLSPGTSQPKSANFTRPDRALFPKTKLQLRVIRNVATRAAATSEILDLALGFRAAHSSGKALIGWDFSLSFPCGSAHALGLEGENGAHGGCAERQGEGESMASKGGSERDCDVEGAMMAAGHDVNGIKRKSARLDAMITSRSSARARKKQKKPGGALMPKGGGEAFCALSQTGLPWAEDTSPPDTRKVAGDMQIKRGTWRRVWNHIAGMVEDDENNSNNRFEAASQMNAMMSLGPYPFWGCPPSKANALLTMKKARCPPQGLRGGVALRERRLAEERCGAHSTWKLFTTGSVGSQTLLGIPRVRAIRFHPDLRDHVRVWPYETGLCCPHLATQDESISEAAHTTVSPSPSIIMAEVYPSLVPPQCEPGEPKDAGQVRALAFHLAHLDSEGLLAELFRGPLASRQVFRERLSELPWMSEAKLAPSDETPVEDLAAIAEEEGWILGVV